MASNKSSVAKRIKGLTLLLPLVVAHCTGLSSMQSCDIQLRCSIRFNSIQFNSIQSHSIQHCFSVPQNIPEFTFKQSSLFILIFHFIVDVILKYQFMMMFNHLNSLNLFTYNPVDSVVSCVLYEE